MKTSLHYAIVALIGQTLVQVPHQTCPSYSKNMKVHITVSIFYNIYFVDPERH